MIDKLENILNGALKFIIVFVSICFVFWCIPLVGLGVLCLSQIYEMVPALSKNEPIVKSDFYLAFYLLIFLFFLFPYVRKWITSKMDGEHKNKTLKENESKEIQKLIAISHNGLNLTGWCINGLNLSKLDFSQSNLTRSRIHNSDFDQANLKQCIFYDSIIQNCCFKNSTLEFSTFETSDKYGNILLNIDFTNANLIHANFRNRALTNIDFTNANLENADFTGAELSNVLFTGANLSGAIGLSEDYKI